MILNGLGFIHSPLYLFSQFFEDKPGTQITEEEKKKAEEAKLQNQKDEAAAKRHWYRLARAC